MIKENEQVPEWMKDTDEVGTDELGFSIGFEDPDVVVPNHAVSTDEGVDYEAIQRWDVTEERNGVIGMSDRRGTRGVQPAHLTGKPKNDRDSVIDSIREITQEKAAAVEQEPLSTFVLLVKGSMVTSGTAEQVTAHVLHVIHNDETVSDEDIVILKEVNLKEFFALPKIRQLLSRVKQKDSQR